MSPKTESGERLAAATVEGNRFGYLPFLDGMRGISILLVLGFHGMGPISKKLCGLWGWAGVDVFFVLSGFLITSLLLHEKAARGSINLKQFYVRRALRIWPAYYLFLIFMIGTPGVALASVYLTNYDVALEWGYTDGANLGHLWSLAMEEQFYLVWPALLCLVARALPMTVLTIGAVWFWRTGLLLAGASWYRLMHAFDTRLDCILFGCLAGLLWFDPTWRRRLQQVLAGKSLPMLLCALVLWLASTLAHPSYPPPAFYSVRLPLFEAMVGLLVLAFLVNRDTLPVRVLSSRPVRWLGVLSYSIYLWHLFVFHRLEAAVPSGGVLLELGKFVCSVAVAVFSYFLIERPFLLIKKRWNGVR